MLLSADRGGSKQRNDERISAQYEVSSRTIERLRQRYVLEGLEVALKGKRRLNLDKIKFDGEVESKLIALRCSDPAEKNKKKKKKKKNLKQNKTITKKN
jgi:hypothetical protein